MLCVGRQQVGLVSIMRVGSGWVADSESGYLIESARFGGRPPGWAEALPELEPSLDLILSAGRIVLKIQSSQISYFSKKTLYLH